MKYIILLLMSMILVGCNNEEAANGESNETEETSASIEIRNVDVQVEELQVILMAEAKTSSNEIFYRLEQGEELLQEERQMSFNGEKEWNAFELEVTLPEEVSAEENPPIIVIYGKNENGDMINPNYIPVAIGKE
ncbi:hypothetical protein [Oceanobacillus salinisoli]|uniref:hypothetical protein n=1 Tax=Oceanobacillus salinisoli TaxID=2678611 RepID=UPI0012E0F60E|nr:hypothetical protein [Oceanobacillus salinisoli]